MLPQELNRRGHFSTLIISTEEHCSYYIDSIGDNNNYVSKNALENFSNLVTDRFGFDRCELKYVESQRQGVNDCGPIALTNIELAVTGQLEKLKSGVSFDQDFVNSNRLAHLSDLLNRQFTPRIQAHEIRNFTPVNESTPRTSRSMAKRPAQIISDSPIKRRK